MPSKTLIRRTGKHPHHLGFRGEIAYSLRAAQGLTPTEFACGEEGLACGCLEMEISLTYLATPLGWDEPIHLSRFIPFCFGLAILVHQDDWGRWPDTEPKADYFNCELKSTGKFWAFDPEKGIEAGSRPEAMLSELDAAKQQVETLAKSGPLLWGHDPTRKLTPQEFADLLASSRKLPPVPRKPRRRKPLNPSLFAECEQCGETLSMTNAGLAAATLGKPMPEGGIYCPKCDNGKPSHHPRPPLAGTGF